MCVVCTLWQKEMITAKEAKMATWEMIGVSDIDALHLQELYDKLDEQERQDKNEQI